MKSDINISSIGPEITRRLWNRSFDGVFGVAFIDENGDRHLDYELLDYSTSSDSMEVTLKTQFECKLFSWSSSTFLLVYSFDRILPSFNK